MMVMKLSDFLLHLSGACIVWSTLVLATVPTQKDEEDILVAIKQGMLRGTRRTADLGINLFNEEITTVDEFLGIPYALPPTGNLRFRVTEPPKPWMGVRDANRHGWVCPQDSSSFEATRENLQSEDCLYLNIFSPYNHLSLSRKYPVMVFIHGGSYFYGTGNRYNGTALAHCGVVVVTINYRLGSFGFLTSGTKDLPGNYGLFDQLQALKWVQENIAFFRGDPSKVTILGSSAGGASVGLLMMSPLAKGLFHHVIAESGTANAMWATHDKSPAQLTQEVIALARGYGCPGKSVSSCLSYLKSLDWRQLRSRNICMILSNTCTEVDPLLKPVVDGKLLLDKPIPLLRQKRVMNVTYMTGTVRAEFGDHFSDEFDQQQMWKEVDGFIFNKYGPAAAQTVMFHYTNWNREHRPYYNSSDDFMDKYNRAEVLTDLGLVAPTSEMASRLSLQKQQDVYLYYFDQAVSYHSIELNYVFGTPFIGGAVDEYESLDIVKNFTTTDKEKSKTFMKMWVNFATYGNPTPEAIGTTWEPLEASKMNYLYLKSSDRGLDLSMDRHLSADHVALWNIFITDISKRCGRPLEERTRLDTSKTWVFFGLTIGLLIVVILLLCVIIWGNHRGKRYSQLVRNNSEKSYAVNL